MTNKKHRKQNHHGRVTEPKLTAVERKVWAAWNRLPELEPSPVTVIADELGMELADVAFVVFPPDTFGPWSDDQEPDPRTVWLLTLDADVLRYHWMLHGSGLEHREADRATHYADEYGMDALTNESDGCIVFVEPSCGNWDCMTPKHQEVEFY